MTAISIAVVWLTAAAIALSLCRAAARGDRQMARVDELERLYAAPDRHCPTCGAWLAGDALFCSAEHQAEWLT